MGCPRFFGSLGASLGWGLRARNLCRRRYLRSCLAGWTRIADRTTWVRPRHACPTRARPRVSEQLSDLFQQKLDTTARRALEQLSPTTRRTCSAVLQSDSAARAFLGLACWTASSEQMLDSLVRADVGQSFKAIYLNMLYPSTSINPFQEPPFANRNGWHDCVPPGLAYLCVPLRLKAIYLYPSTSINPFQESPFANRDGWHDCVPPGLAYIPLRTTTPNWSNSSPVTTLSLFW
jgi:hypothetical protein